MSTRTYSSGRRCDSLRLRKPPRRRPVGQARRFGHPIAAAAGQREPHRSRQVDPVADGDEDGGHPAACPHRRTHDLVTVHQVGAGAPLGRQLRVSPHQEGLGAPDGGRPSEQADVAGQAEAPGMGQSLAVRQDEIGRRLQALQGRPGPPAPLGRPAGRARRGSWAPCWRSAPPPRPCPPNGGPPPQRGPARPRPFPTRRSPPRSGARPAPRCGGPPGRPAAPGGPAPPGCWLARGGSRPVSWSHYTFTRPPLRSSWPTCPPVGSSGGGPARGSCLRRNDEFR